MDRTAAASHKPKRSRPWLTWLVLIPLAGCATIPSPAEMDIAEATFEASESQVRTAVVQVLTEGNYEVQAADAKEPVLKTGYRNEMDGPWNALLHSRFGRGRSKVEVTITPEDAALTHVVIRVAYEGKDSLFASWRAYVPPLPQSAANQIRLLKNALGLL